MRKNRMRKTVTSVFGFVGWFSLALASLAAWQVSQDAENILTTASFKTEIVEEYEEPEHVEPSQEVTKRVDISNTGSVDAIVRVSLQRQFGTQQSDGTFTADPDLDSEMIELNLGTTYWMEKEGYYYYKEVLKAGERTKEPLLSSYRFSEKAGNAYMGKDARIVVRMESMQADEAAVSLWNVTSQELGLAIPENRTEKDTTVTYLGAEKGFEIEEGQTDLFANFKDLLPGCTRIQKITVNNASDEEAELFLRAEAARSSETKETRQLIQKLLDTYAVIEIRDGSSVLYQGPVSGNLSGKESTMREDLSLGLFKAGESRTLTVQLSLDPGMDNRYMELTGKVKWVFTVNGADEAIYPAKTGLDERITWWLSLFLICMALAGVSHALVRSADRSDKEV
jgi:alternate signal-mediated exported protein